MFNATNLFPKFLKIKKKSINCYPLQWNGKAEAYFFAEKHV